MVVNTYQMGTRMLKYTLTLIFLIFCTLKISPQAGRPRSSDCHQVERTHPLPS